MVWKLDTLELRDLRQAGCAEALGHRAAQAQGSRMAFHFRPSLGVVELP